MTCHWRLDDDSACSERYNKRPPAEVAELVDALASGASVHLDVEVRVLSSAPIG